MTDYKSSHYFNCLSKSPFDKFLRDFTKVIFSAPSFNHSLRNILGDIA